jgi:hypothetical protein
MKPLRYLLLTAALGAALATSSATARAGDHLPPFDPHTQAATLAQAGGPGSRASLFFSNFKRRQLPVFQAAPWYNYWPYDAHFLTPAPISGQFYGPPLTGNFPVNPYFPAPHLSGYGPMPGGPPPGAH